MKYRYFFTAILSFFILAACENTLNFEGTTDEENNDLVINAVAVADVPFTAYITKAERADIAIITPYVDFHTSMYRKDDPVDDYHQRIYLERVKVENAVVEVTVNGKDTYHMTYDQSFLGYTCDYIPQVDDRIVVKASFDGQALTVGTTVPPKPHIEILEEEVLTDNPYQDMNGLAFVTDSVMRITCRITDTGTESFYRLRVRGERDLEDIYGDTHFYFYVMQDIFFSSDLLFVDNRLHRSFGGWPAYFTNVFDSRMMKDGQYTFTVDSPKVPSNATGLYYIEKENHEGVPKIQPRVMVELESITKDYYNFLKSMELYRITASDGYAEPVQIYSNVQNGWGILGALSYDRHFIDYGE